MIAKDDVDDYKTKCEDWVKFFEAMDKKEQSDTIDSLKEKAIEDLTAAKAFSDL